MPAIPILVMQADVNEFTSDKNSVNVVINDFLIHNEPTLVQTETSEAKFFFIHRLFTIIPRSKAAERKISRDARDTGGKENIENLLFDNRHSEIDNWQLVIEGVFTVRYFAAILALGLAFTLLTASAEPVLKPGIVPTSWELEFEYKTPQPITIMLPGWKEKRTFWYMLYTVTNRSGADRIFVPGFCLYTDTSQVTRAGEKIPSAVFLAIKKRHNNPLLMDMASITGRLLQGEDNARDGVAIWTDLDHKARSFDVFVAGMSGERMKIKLPKPITVTVDDKDGKKKKITKTEVILSKTLYLRYFLPGDASARSADTPKLRKKQWVMR